MHPVRLRPTGIVSRHFLQVVMLWLRVSHPVDHREKSRYPPVSTPDVLCKVTLVVVGCLANQIS